MTRTNQGGSGLSFVVIGVILVALLAGGVYLVRQQLTQPDQTWLPEESGETVVSDDDEEVAADPVPENEESLQVADVSAAELPQTGIEDVTPIFSLGLLSLTAVAYARSRRPELSL
jgi:hypothetical protein